MPRKPLSLVAVICVALSAAATAAAHVDQSSAGDPYKVMMITGVNTSINNSPAVPDVARITSDYINAHGGINGRPLQVTVCNHQSSASVVIDCARQAIAGSFDDVIDSGNAFSTSSTPLLDAAGIPRIASQPNTTPDFQSTFFFPIQGPVQAVQGADVAYLVKNLHLKKIGWIGADVATSLLGITVEKAVVRRQGGTWTGAIPTPLTTTDYAPYVQKLKGLNSQGLICGVASSSQANLLQTLQQFGVTAPCANAITAIPDPSLPIANGFIAASQLPVAGTTNTKGDKLFVQIMTAAGKGDAATLTSPNAFFAFLALEAVQALAKTVHGALTPTSMMAAARKANLKHPIDLLGVVSWTPGAKGPNAFKNCPASSVYVYEIHNGGFVLKAKYPSIWKLAGYVG